MGQQTGPSIPMIHASIAGTLLDVLDDMGAPLAGGLKVARMPTRLAEDRSGYVPVRTYCRWVDRQARDQGIDNLGLLAIDRVGANGLLPGVVKTIVTSPTLYDGLQKFAQLAYRESSQVSIWLDESHDDLRLCHRGSYPRSLPGQPDMSWWALGLVIHIVRLFLGPMWHPEYMAVPAQGRGLAFAQELFPDSRLIEDPEIAWIALPRHVLTARPLSAGNEALPRLAAAALASPPASLEDCLQELIVLYLPDGWPRVEEAAEVAGLSVRTLQRRLATQNLTYNRLVSNIRFEKARDLLESGELPIIEIARRLGYSESAHFARAFRRIAGVTPGQYRRTLS